MKLVLPAVQAVLDSGPRNLYGEPIFRLIFGADRFTWVEGQFTDFTESGLFIRRTYASRLMHKYPKIDRWYLEAWQPPEFFGSREMWEAQTTSFENMELFRECGPYPSRGDYTVLALLEHQETGEYVTPTPLLVRHILSRCKMLSAQEIRDTQTALREAADLDLHKTIDDMFGDPFPFHGSTNNTTPKPLTTLLEEENKRGKGHEGYN